jgi:hypothetical protein
MPLRKKLLRGWNQETTERSLLMRRLPFVSMTTGSMDSLVRPLSSSLRANSLIAGYIRSLAVGWYEFTSLTFLSSHSFITFL